MKVEFFGAFSACVEGLTSVGGLAACDVVGEDVDSAAVALPFAVPSPSDTLLGAQLGLGCKPLGAGLEDPRPEG